MVNLGINDAVSQLTTGGVILLSAVFLTLLVFAVIGVVRSVLGFEPFIPLEAGLLPQRAVTNALAQARRDNHPLSLPSKWNPNIEPPMLSRVMIDNKLRGDELQKKLARLNNMESPLNKLL